MTEKKIIKKTTRMSAIVKKLPKNDFGKAELEKRIRETQVGGSGINNRQSVQEYVGLLLDERMIEPRRMNMYRVTDAARTPGTILITVESKLRVPLVQDLIERALNGVDGVKIIDGVE